MAGWIKLHRKILDWEWYDDANTMRVFLHCLLRCNHKDNKWRGILIKRGSFLTSFETLSKETGLSVSKIRTSVRKLKSTSEMTSSSHARYTVVSIPSYDSYQGDDKLNDNQIADSSQTLDKLLTTNKNEKNEDNEKNEKKTTIHQQADKESIFPAGSRSKSIQEQKRTKVLGQMPLMAKIGKWLGRKETTLWNVAEAKALQQLNPSKDEIDAVEAYYSAKMPDAPYRMSIDTLLNNWSGEVDRANTYQPQQRKTAVELNEEAKQARRAYNMQNIF